MVTPHPGEMARLTGKSTERCKRIASAPPAHFAMTRALTVVLKGERTVIAFPDGRVWINPTGTPAMGTGGSGDILTDCCPDSSRNFLRSPMKPSRRRSTCTASPARSAPRDVGRNVADRHRHLEIPAGSDHGGAWRRIAGHLRRRPLRWASNWRANFRRAASCC